MELVGTIIAVLPAQSGVSQRTGNPWMSQDYVLEVPGQYPRRCTFRIFGEDRIKQFAIQQGEQKKAEETATNMIKKKYPAADIAEITGLSLAEVEALQKKISTK